MRNVLSRELAKLILGNIGAGPNSVTGLLDPLLDTGKTIEISQEDGSVTSHHIFSGCVQNQVRLDVAMMNIGVDDERDFVLALEVQDTGVFGLRFDWFDEMDSGSFLSHDRKSWIPMTMAQKLRLALSFEVFAQEGLIWLPVDEPTKIRAKANLLQLMVDGEDPT